MDSVQELANADKGWTAMGRHLRKIRLGRDWGQEDLRQASGVSVATIRAIENHKVGKRHTPRVLKLISNALGKHDEYLNDYRKNPPAEEPGDISEVTEAAPPPQRASDLLVPRLDEIDEMVVARLNELVVPRLESMESQVRRLVDVSHSIPPEVQIDKKHSGDAE